MLRAIFPALLLICLLSACGQTGGNSQSSNGNNNQSSTASTGRSNNTQSGNQGPTSALTVDVTQAVLADTTQQLDTSGGLFAWQDVAIGSEISGYRVAEVLADVGDSVHKGQVLARLDSTLLKQALDQALAANAVAKANRDQAESQARRANSLQQSGLISKQDAEQVNTTLATTSAQLQNTESQLQTARQRLEYAELKAPDDGVISIRNIAPGQIVTSGATLFSLIRDYRVEWRAEIPAAQIGKVKRGMQAEIRRADGSYATGLVRTVSPGLDSNTQRGTAYVDLRLEAQIRPGMYVSGRINLSRAKTLSVPLAAVAVRDGYSYVFVVQQDLTVRQQRVVVNRILDQTVELREGISTDDAIVASGVGLLRDGDRVKVANRSDSASK